MTDGIRSWAVETSDVPQSDVVKLFADRSGVMLHQVIVKQHTPLMARDKINKKKAMEYHLHQPNIFIKHMLNDLIDFLSTYCSNVAWYDMPFLIHLPDS